MAALVCALFFFSGASALIFETLWFHQAGLVLGRSVWATSLVLSGFMAGLALGNALAARRAAAIARPIRVYGLLELAIAVTGVGLVFGLPQLGPALAPALAPLAPWPWLLNAMRFGLAFALLLVPSTAMGFTLPLLARALASSETSFGPVLGRLYAWNTFGAVAGAVASEAVLVGALGIRGAALATGALGGAAAAAALVLSRRFETAAVAVIPGADLPSRGAGRWLLAVFMSGFVLLALEVVWFRFLTLYVVSTSLAFALMLAVVLTGIALGGGIAGHVLRLLPRAAAGAPLLGFLAGALCVACYAAFPWAAALQGGELAGEALQILVLCTVLMLPVSLASGALFTLVGASLRLTRSTHAEAAGGLTFANTAGGALGALAGGFVLLPGLGMESSLWLAALAYGGIGALLLGGAGLSRRVAWAAVAAFVLAIALFPFGHMQSRHLRATLARWVNLAKEEQAWVREGPTETIIYVEQTSLGAPSSHRMITNGYSMSSSDYRSRRYMKLFVVLPAALHPDMRDALLISFGVGSTARGLLDTPGIEHVDVVDISRDVLEMNHLVFPDPARQPLLDPRVTVHVEDGRYFLQTTAERYDLVTGEPPPPRLAGVVNLYTREYFELMRGVLRDGGIATYWLPMHALTDTAALGIVRSFCEAFPDCSLWNGTATDLVLMGTRGPAQRVEEHDFARQWRDPIAAAELRALGFERPEQLGALFIADGPYLLATTRDVPPVTDDMPRRIMAPPSSPDGWRRLMDEWLDSRASRSRFAASAWVSARWPAELRQASLPYFDFQAAINGLQYDAVRRSGIEALHALLTDSTLEAPVLWLLGSDADQQAVIDAASPARRRQPDMQLHLGIRKVAARDFEGAVEPLERALSAPPLRPPAARLLGYALCMAGRTDEAAVVAAREGRVQGGDPKEAAYWAWLAATFGLDLSQVALR